MTGKNFTYNHENIEKIVENANRRSGARLTVKECLQEINSQTPRKALEKLKEMLKKRNYQLEELQRLIACLWVYHDLKLIQFPEEEYCMALSVQNNALINNPELAARLLKFLEKQLDIKE
ncbi:MAG: hypothetical protein GF308_04145 [Candidatus Heimdallarchaeota archaeon]|nr:hypothetical protein [Candidatus Heimdallarchaeota archaeon]